MFRLWTACRVGASSTQIVQGLAVNINEKYTPSCQKKPMGNVFLLLKYVFKLLESFVHKK